MKGPSTNPVPDLPDSIDVDSVQSAPCNQAEAAEPTEIIETVESLEIVTTPIDLNESREILFLDSFDSNQATPIPMDSDDETTFKTTGPTASQKKVSPENKRKISFIAPPDPVSFTVSHSIAENAMRKPGKLFPEESLEVPPTTTEVLEKNKELQRALKKVEIMDTVSEEKKEEQSLSMELLTHPLAHEDSVDHAVTPRTERFISLYITNLSVDNVCFDRISVTKSNQKTLLLSSTGLSSGTHEWNIEIIRCDVDLQEIGVIGTSDIDKVPVSGGGILDTAGFKSRASYGSEMSSGALFYGSFNANGRKRCHRDLSPHFKVGFTVDDRITVILDLDVWRIKYLLNGEAVRYAMSLERQKTYYPVICFSGNCEYELSPS